MPFSSFAAQFRHRHDFHHQASPSREMLRALAIPRLGVILLPCKTRSLPFVEHVVDEISA